MVAEHDQLVALRDDADVAHLAAAFHRRGCRLRWCSCSARSSPKNGRHRLANAKSFSVSLTRTLLPSRSRTANLPVALTHCGGGTALPSSKSKLQGRSGMTRMRAVPAIDPIVALTRPACAPAAASAVNLPSATVPFRFSSVQVAAPGKATAAPLRVERARGQRDRFTWLQDELGRRHEQRRWNARRQRRCGRLDARRRIGRRARWRHLRADRVDRVHRNHVDTARARRPATAMIGSGLLLAAQPVLIEDLRAVGERPDDVELAVLGADIELAVGEHRR